MTVLAVIVVLGLLAVLACVCLQPAGAPAQPAAYRLGDVVMQLIRRPGISWYHGSNIGDLGSFTQAVGSRLSSQIACSSRVPGSSSDGGAGGSSGSGGGGGGGR